MFAGCLIYARHVELPHQILELKEHVPAVSQLQLAEHVKRYILILYFVSFLSVGQIGFFPFSESNVRGTLWLRGILNIKTSLLMSKHWLSLSYFIF